MYYLTNICFLCLKNNIKVQTVLISDSDGVEFNEKLTWCFPEIINFPPDTHKLACMECLEKLRISYDFKQAVTRNNDVFREYLENLQAEHKSYQQLSVVLAGTKRRKTSSVERKLPHVRESESINILNHPRTNDKFSQPISNENVLPTTINCPTEQIIVKTENVETDKPVAETEMVLVKEEHHFFDNTSNYLNEESMEYEEDGSKNYSNNSNESTTHNLNSTSADRSVLQHKQSDTKFCATCQKLLFKDMNDINSHLNFHIQKTQCSVCEKSVEEIVKYQQHILLHCSLTSEPQDNGEKLSCAVCEKDFDNLQSLKTHIYTGHMNNLNCVLCARSFSCRNNLLRHVLMLHCAVKRFQCRVCNKRFTTKSSVDYHMIYMHYSGKVLVCKHCKLTFRSPKALTNHIRKIHPKEKLKEIHFDSDPKSSQIEEIVLTKENLKKVEEVIEPEKVFVKEELRFSEDEFSSDEEFKELEGDDYAPKNISVGIKKPQECNNTNSVDVENLIEVSIIVPITESSYCEPTSNNSSKICEICQEMHRHLNILRVHLKVHMRESACSLCKDSVENISELQLHMLTPCGNTNITDQNASNAEKKQLDFEKIQCAVCLKKFFLNNLKKHMHTHIDNLTCVLCARSFTEKMSVHRHLLQHCNLKPFQCESCDKCYTTKEGLKYHMTYTHLKKVHVCQYCEKTLRSSKSLRTHILNLHPNETFRCDVCKKVFLYYNELEKHAKLHTSRGEAVVSFVCRANLKQD